MYDAFHMPKSAARNNRNDHKYRADVHCDHSGRNVRFKVPRLDKKCVVDLVSYKNKTSDNIRRIKRQLLLFHTVFNNVSPFP